MAVATGLIRPDDSLPDLEAHIPARVSQALTWAPLAGAALAAVAGHFVGMRDVTLPTHWGLDLRPDRLITARPAAAVPVLLSVGLATWTLIDARHNRKVDVSLSAQTLGSAWLPLPSSPATPRATSRPPGVLVSECSPSP